MRFDTIICAVDFSDCSKAALKAACELARESKGALTLVHIFNPPTYSMGSGVFDMAALFEREQQSARAELESWRATAIAAGVERVETTARMGSAWDEIVRLAETTAANLIVVGTHGRTGLAHALIGSVAEKVVRHAPCNVLVVRPAG